MKRDQTKFSSFSMGCMNSAGSHRKLFLSTCWNARKFPSPDSLLGALYSCSPCTPRGRAGRICLWFWKDFIIVIHYPASCTYSRNYLHFTFACGLRTLYILNELKSLHFKHRTTYFVHFIFFLRIE